MARILKDELGTPKTYVAEFGEAPGYHLHFHVIPRPSYLDPMFRGPKVFSLLGGADGDDADARDRFASRLSARLTTTN